MSRSDHIRHRLATAESMLIHFVGYIHGLLDGMRFTRTSYALDRVARQAALSRLFSEVTAGSEALAA
ncbi:hypothetical protein FJ434_06260 [Mesorhizobium sp. B2-5-13]|nr:hypothetical protein FJ434_06260 [Mesorhizobium sp. B2-5-13]TPK54761.1 hypothetical protein FJ560_02215 [Mesorhizobium sp. B2-5-5]